MAYTPASLASESVYYPHVTEWARVKICAVLALLVASIVIVVTIDAIACPSGASGASPLKDTSGHKTQWKIKCHRASGDEVDGSMPAAFFSWVGLLVGTFALSFFTWRFVRPLPLPPTESTSPTASLDAPTDRRDQRRHRKREEHKRRQRH